MKKHILFDLDGTLTDSGEGIINCAALALEAFGLPVPSRHEMRVFVGPPLQQTLVRFGVPENRVSEAVTVFRSRYSVVGKFENVPYSGIHTLLETLVSHGHKLYVATSKPEIMAVEILEHFDLAEYFTKICGATLDESRVNKDEVIACLLDEIGRPKNMVMVGDTAFDVLGAKAHGIPTIGVAWGYGEASDMEKAGAAAVARDMSELLSLLEDTRLS